jgi:hypothetical protein
MNKPAKLPEIRKEAFTQARESLGLSIKEISSMACLSARQIEQIENGQMGSFYSLQIKLTAAKKIAKLLKLTESEAFDYGHDTVQKERLTEEIISVPEIQPAVQPQIQKVITTSAPEPAMSLGANQQNTLGYFKKKPLIAIGIVAAGIFAVVNLRPPFFPEPPKEATVAVAETVKEAVPLNAPIEEEKPASVMPAAVPLPTPAPVTPVPTAAAVVSADCPAADSAAISYTPDAPRKAGDMVYVQAKTAQTVCVIDATGKTQSKTLDAGAGTSLYGKPPFKVLTLGLNQVDLYFQGFKVRLANSAVKTIILEPAELSQLVAPAESQAR